MVSGQNWISLRLIRPAIREAQPRRPFVTISIPKKVLRLATRRNRLKRLIKEAIRADGSFKEKDKFYAFVVMAYPGRVSLNDVKTALTKL